MDRRNNSSRNKRNARNTREVNPVQEALKKAFIRRKRNCPLSGANAPTVDYKNVALLKRFVSERGKILPRRITAVCSKKQRELAEAIKRARMLALLPFAQQN